MSYQKRFDAYKNGHKHYKGTPCGVCGSTIRYVSSGGCVTCTKKQASLRQKFYRDTKYGQAMAMEEKAKQKA